MSDIIKTQRSFAIKAMHHPAHRFDHLYRLICQQEWIWAAVQGVLANKGARTNLSDVEIILQCNAELRGIAQYYALAHNYNGKIGRLVFLARMSFLKTLAGKHRTTYAQIAEMLDRGKYLAVRYKTKEYKLFKTKDVTRNKLYDKDEYPNTAIYKARTEILERMEANKCEYCETEGGYFDVHHVHKLVDMKDGKEPWQKLMIARQRKTIVLCIHCHDQLHAGTLPDWRHLRK